MKKTIVILCTSFILITMFSSQLLAQDITGKWHGLIEFPNASLRLDLEVVQQDGKYKATAYSPDQGNDAIPIDKFSYTDGKMEFSIYKLDVEYSGQMDKTSSTIKGNFKQHGQSLPLELGRKYIEATKASPDN